MVRSPELKTSGTITKKNVEKHTTKYTTLTQPREAVAAPEFGGGHRGGKCDSEGANIQNFAENG